MRTYNSISCLASRIPGRDAGLDALGLESVPEPVGIVAAVAEQPLGSWQIVQQRCRAGLVADLPSGHEEARRRPLASARGWALCSGRLWCDRSGVPDPLFYPQARCCAVRLEVGRVDHDRLRLGIRRSQLLHHANEHQKVLRRLRQSGYLEGIRSDRCVVARISPSPHQAFVTGSVR